MLSKALACELSPLEEVDDDLWSTIRQFAEWQVELAEDNIITGADFRQSND